MQEDTPEQKIHMLFKSTPNDAKLKVSQSNNNYMTTNPDGSHDYYEQQRKGGFDDTQVKDSERAVGMEVDDSYFNDFQFVTERDGGIVDQSQDHVNISNRSIPSYMKTTNDEFTGKFGPNESKQFLQSNSLPSQQSSLNLNGRVNALNNYKFS